MILIGLTGGIGSGKSTVAGMFRTLGIPVYESDSRAKWLMENNQEVKSKIKDLLGNDAYLPDQNLNRTWIASQVFKDQQKLDQLNSIVHPAVFEDLQSWASEHEQTSAPYLIQESALLFEENLTSRFNAVILVVANEETRISRVMARDKVNKEKVLSRIENQLTDDQKVPLADYVIFNDNERSLINQVMDIDKMIRSQFTAG